MSKPFMQLVITGLLPLLAQVSYGETAPIGKDVAFRVQLTSGLSSRDNKKGDKISAIVLEPQEYKGATMEGTVDEAKSSGKVNKSSRLKFSFASLVLPSGDNV